MLEAQNYLIPCVVLEMCEIGFMINAVKAFSIVPCCQLEKMNIISDYIQLFDFLNLPAGEVRYHKDKGGGVGGPNNRIGLQRGFRNLVKLFICGLPH